MSVFSATSTFEPDWDNLSWGERQQYNLRIYEVFKEKNYNSVNMRTCDFISMLPHLDMYKREAKTLATELEAKGYDVEIIPVPANRFKAIAIIYKDGVHIHPASLIEVFKTLRVRGGRK